jgi:hypothetical protein
VPATPAERRVVGYVQALRRLERLIASAKTLESELRSREAKLAPEELREARRRLASSLELTGRT